jgi:Zn finger protein HypA/HybF involved in hydrogenase expression
MASNYNQPIFFASLQKLEVVSLAGPHLLKAIMIPVIDVGTKEGPNTKHMRADAIVAQNGDDDDRAQHQAHHLAVGLVSGYVAATQTVVSRATSFNPGTVAQGANRKVVTARQPAEVATASTQHKKPRPEMICPLCHAVVSGGKVRVKRGVNRHIDDCVFDLFVIKFNLQRFRVHSNVGFLKSHCLWMDWQADGWLVGVSAALLREKKRESTVSVEKRSCEGVVDRWRVKQLHTAALFGLI